MYVSSPPRPPGHGSPLFTSGSRVWQRTNISQIADSFRRFGVSENTKNLLVIKVSVSPGITHDSVEDHLSKVIKGTPVAFDDDTFRGMTDVAKVNKVYKLGSGNTKSKPAVSSAKEEVNGTRDSGGVLDEQQEMEVAIIGMMAL